MSSHPGADFTVRLLGERDTATLRDMLKLFGREFGDTAAYESKQPADPYLTALLARDTFIAVCAESNEQVVGGFAACVLPKFEQERSEVYIYDLAVDSGQRRRGIATALMST